MSTPNDKNHDHTQHALKMTFISVYKLPADLNIQFIYTITAVKYCIGRRQNSVWGGAGNFRKHICYLGLLDLPLFPVLKKIADDNLQYFVVRSAKWLMAMGVSKRQGDILNRSWESLPSETSSLHGCGESSPWVKTSVHLGLMDFPS